MHVRKNKLSVPLVFTPLFSSFANFDAFFFMIFFKFYVIFFDHPIFMPNSLIHFKHLVQILDQF